MSLSLAFFETSYFERAKSSLIISVYGSYAPECYSRLKSLVDCLNSHGYSSASLVRDYAEPAKKIDEDQDAFNVKKSFYWLSRSEVNVLVFFCECPTDGVTAELTYLCEKVPEKMPKSIVLFEDYCFDAK